VENTLRGHPDVLDAAVIGVPAKSGGERVVAVVIPRPGTTIDEAAMRDWCRERLSGYKVPREIVAIEDLPRSMLGKVLRKQVRDDFLANHA